MGFLTASTSKELHRLLGCKGVHDTDAKIPSELQRRGRIDTKVYSNTGARMDGYRWYSVQPISEKKTFYHLSMILPA